MAASAFGPYAWAPLERALKAYFDGDQGAVLTILADEGEPEPMPVAVFFRSWEDLREVDRVALAEARGRVLDGGAGVGALALVLQEEGHPVTAVEVIPGAVEIMRERGVEDARVGRLEDLVGAELFDTVLLLMNGTALAGTLNGLNPFLTALAELLAPGGQVLLDSTNVLDSTDHRGSTRLAHGSPVAFEGAADSGEGEGWEGEGDPGGAEDRGGGGYPGEFQYQMEFRGEKGAPFPQLFIDPETLAAAAREGGWRMELIWSSLEGEYLARLTRASKGEGDSEGAVRRVLERP